MSDTVGIIVIVGGLLISAVGLYLLSRTPRQVIGLIVMIAGFTIAGTGLLTIEDTTVEERTPATIVATPTEAATPTA
jgi:hypothetical protein